MWVFTPQVGWGWGGAFHQLFGGGGVQHARKKWTQQDLRFCKNEESKRSNNNEK